jgi:protein-S-isoprenylcysteine O-methyltransferase Ste14
MYAAMLIFVIGTPLLLGSWYGILVGMIFVAGFARRAVLEERMLRKELPGYEEYMKEVKFRIIPFFW